MKKYAFLSSLVVALCSLFVMACSNNDNTIEEYPNWKAQNDAFFNATLQQANTNIQNGNTNWRVYRNWSLPDASTGYNISNDDQIVVHALETSASSDKPYSNDSVEVVYRARILPSTSYPTGFVFMQTYRGNYNANTNGSAWIGVTGRFVVNSETGYSVPTGLSTALQQMSVGDRWEIYIPSKLGFSTNEASTIGIPQNSVIIYDVTLLNIRR